MSESWLKQRMTIEEAAPELAGTVLGEKWKLMKSKMREGDELWYFSTPTDMWEGLWGRSGIALVRDGESIDHIVTLMS